MTDHGKSDVSKLVKVKPLKWRAFDWTDIGIPCSYSIDGDDEDGWVVKLTWYGMSEFLEDTFPTRALAKAAAQADFERRILACLTTRMENE